MHNNVDRKEEVPYVPITYVVVNMDIAAPPRLIVARVAKVVHALVAQPSHPL